MPIGSHISKCRHCLQQFICGDAIVSTCHVCSIKGHRGESLLERCPICDDGQPEKELDAHERAMLEVAVDVQRRQLWGR